MMKFIPYAQATVVKYEGRKYLIEKVNHYCGDIKYSLVGHKKLGSKGLGGAWYKHSDVSLERVPVPETWDMLIEATQQGEY